MAPNVPFGKTNLQVKGPASASLARVETKEILGKIEPERGTDRDCESGQEDAQDAVRLVYERAEIDGILRGTSNGCRAGLFVPKVEFA